MNWIQVATIIAQSGLTVTKVVFELVPPVNFKYPVSRLTVTKVVFESIFNH